MFIIVYLTNDQTSAVNMSESLSRNHSCHSVQRSMSDSDGLSKETTQEQKLGSYEESI